MKEQLWTKYSVNEILIMADRGSPEFSINSFGFLLIAYGKRQDYPLFFAR